MQINASIWSVFLYLKTLSIRKQTLFYKDMEEKVMTTEQITTAEKTLDAVKATNGRNILPLNLQLFADGGDGDGDGANGSNTGDSGTDGDGDNKAQNQNAALSTEALDKLIQSRVDKITADLGKKNATLQKELDNLKKAKLSDEEIKNLEIADKEKALTEKEQALLERENRLYAIKAIKEAELDDGSDLSLELIDFVMGEDEKAIDEKVKSFKSLVERFVTAKVDATFKANGRTPNGSGKSGSADDKKTSVAAELGKAKAEQQKKSNDILNYYIGGNK
jgi:hypothetical protein